MTGYRRIILTGGIGSGKSYVARRMVGRGWRLIEADAIGHQILEPHGGAYALVVERWPSVVVEGRIDRALLAEIVFSDAGQLRVLEEITHPRIRTEILERVEVAACDVVVEIPLLRDWFEGWPVVVVTAPLAVRMRRLRARGMADPDIERRIASQPTDSQWRAAADFVVANDEESDLAAQLDELDRFVAGFSVTGDR